MQRSCTSTENQVIRVIRRQRLDSAHRRRHCAVIGYVVNDDAVVADVGEALSSRQYRDIVSGLVKLLCKETPQKDLRRRPRIRITRLPGHAAPPPSDELDLQQALT